MPCLAANAKVEHCFRPRAGGGLAVLYSAIRNAALHTSLIEATQATLTDLFDEEAGAAISNSDDVQKITRYMRAFRIVQHNRRDERGLPISTRPLCDVHRVLMEAVRGASMISPLLRGH